MFTGRLVPIYPLMAGVSARRLAGWIDLARAQCLDQVEDDLPPELARGAGLMGRRAALTAVHAPEDWAQLAEARRRLVFEELFYLTAGLEQLRLRRQDAPGCRFQAADWAEFGRLLPFALTGAQRRTLEEIGTDLASGGVMNRLVQGDVGSGKTAVAAGAIFLAAKSGYQSAFMAPTEILARQHSETMQSLLAGAGIRVALLTAAVKGTERRQLLAALAAGEIDLLVGTHAILTQTVQFRRLGLVVTDEQHRFGVNQRASLAAKGDGTRPHVLVMSATPIPRTLALIVYGDLDVSVLDELPAGRQKIETYLVGSDKRQRMYGFVRAQVQAGRQVYLVCPAVEDGETGEQDLKSVRSYAEELRTRVFPDLRVGLIHGKLKPKEKEAVMADFARGGIDILVATTVIEVGVDVPNANLMVVENAERFGLSQLHQLRGRVGRGRWQSYCVLVTDSREEKTRARLKTLCQTGDGFRIAQEDLNQRGPGDFFGSRQHGLPQLRVADLAGDTRTLYEAQAAARALLETDPQLALPEHAPVRRRVARLFEENPDIFN